MNAEVIRIRPPRLMSISVVNPSRSAVGIIRFLWSPASKASAITIPTMVFQSDGCAFPDQVKKFYSKLCGEKELVWADGTHYDYYDSQAQIDNAVANVTRFFSTHLAEALAA